MVEFLYMYRRCNTLKGSTLNQEAMVVMMIEQGGQFRSMTDEMMMHEGCARERTPVLMVKEEDRKMWKLRICSRWNFCHFSHRRHGCSSHVYDPVTKNAIKTRFNQPSSVRSSPTVEVQVNFICDASSAETPIATDLSA